MTLTAALAVQCCQRALALAVVLQMLELLSARTAFSERGVWSFDVLRVEHQALPALLRWLYAWILPYRAFVLLLSVQLSSALALLAFGRQELLLPMWFIQVAICVRFRGSYNGGSDYMTVLISFALGLSSVAPQHALLRHACLLYIAVQLTLSYVISGLAKLKEAAWRDGSALAAFVAQSPYPLAHWLTRHRTPARQLIGAYAAIGFECLFPLAWLDSRVCLAFLGAGCVFHVVNAFVFGLNRFLFAWLAAYPALLFCSQ